MKYLVFAEQILQHEVLVDADSAEEAGLLVVEQMFNQEDVITSAADPTILEVVEAP